MKCSRVVRNPIINRENAIRFSRDILLVNLTYFEDVIMINIAYVETYVICLCRFHFCIKRIFQNLTCGFFLFLCAVPSKTILISLVFWRDETFKCNSLLALSQNVRSAQLAFLLPFFFISPPT